MHFVELTLFREPAPPTPVKILLNPEHISSIEPQNEHSRVLLSNHTEFRVNESLDEIMALAETDVSVLAETSELDEPSDDEQAEGTDAEPDEFDELTVSELQAYAKENGIDLGKARTKPEIQAVLRKAELESAT